MIRRPLGALAAQTLASRVAIYASGFGASLLIARGLGPEGQGIYVIAMTLGTIAAQCVGPGFEQAQARRWSRGLASRADLHAAALLLAGLLGIASTGLVVGAWLVGRTGPFTGIGAAAIAAVAALLPLRVYVTMVRGLLIVDGRLELTNAALLAGDLARTAGVVALFATNSLSVEAVLALFWLTMLVPAAVMAPHAGAPGRLRARLVREELRDGTQLAPYFLFLFLNLRLDVILLAALSAPAEVGLYVIAVMVAELVWLATDSVAFAVRERQFRSPAPEALAATAQATRMSLVIGLVAVPPLLIAAPAAIPVIVGDEFGRAVDALWALAPAAAVMAAWRALTAALVRFGRPATATAIAAAALTANVALNLVLIPPLGIAGAALASLVAYSLGTVLTAGAVTRVTDLRAAELLPRPRDARRLLAFRPFELRALRRFRQ